MEHLPFEITSEEYEFYGERLILLEGDRLHWWRRRSPPHGKS